MKKALKKFGLTDKEIETFLILLELGAQPISVIAKNAHVHRPSMYNYLESLKKHQLVEIFERRGMKYAKCIPVDHIMEVIKNKEYQIHQASESIEAAIPELKKLESQMSFEPKVKFFEGKEGLYKSYSELLIDLAKTDEIFCFINFLPPKKDTIDVYNMLYDFDEKMKKIDSFWRIIAPLSEPAIEYKKLDADKKQKTLLINPHSYEFEYGENYILKDKLYYTTINPRNHIFSYCLQNDIIVRLQKEYFELSWKTALKENKKICEKIGIKP